MDKKQAIDLLGGSVKDAAQAIGCTGTAIRLWPAELPPRIRDRVQAALWRRLQAEADASVVEAPAEVEAGQQVAEAEAA